MKNIKKVLQIGLIVTVLLMGRVSYADGGDVNLTVKNNGATILSTTVPLPEAGTTNINDSDGGPHLVDARSVLNIISLADAKSSAFNISTLTYYPSFSAFYLKCINADGSNLCDNWQYKVNDADPGVGMDQEVLSGGEDIVLFFGDENPEPPAPDPTPVETPPVEHSSSSSSGGSFVSSSSFEAETPAPVPALVPVTAAPVVPEVPTTTPVVENIPKPTVQPVVKKVAVKPSLKSETAKVNNLAATQSAAVVTASPSKVVTTAPVPKESWIQTFFKWLFNW